MNTTGHSVVHVSGAAGQIQQQSFWQTYWNELPSNTLESIISSISISTFIASFEDNQISIEHRPTYAITTGVFGGLVALTHAAVSPFFKKFNKGMTILPIEKEWLRSALACGVVYSLEGLINPSKTFTERAITVVFISSIRALLCTRKVNEAGWFIALR